MSKNGTHFNDLARLQKYTSAIRSCVQPQDAMTEGRDEKKKGKMGCTTHAAQWNLILHDWEILQPA